MCVTWTQIAFYIGVEHLHSFFIHRVLEIPFVNSKRKIPMRIKRQGFLLNDLRIKSTLLLAVEMT